MEVPKNQRIFCPICRKHTEHVVDVSKKKQRRTMAQGQRRYLRKLQGYGSFPRPKPDHEKAVKKTDLRYKCSVCGKKHEKGEGFRNKKFKIVKK
ncbi:MAG: 50S ribosomal protein L44e [Candidatus Aenigmatarchaeota archaeon]